MRQLMKLSLRDLFWLMLVVGMGCAWWLDRARFLKREAMARENYSRYAGMSETELDDFFGDDMFTKDLEPPIVGSKLVDPSYPGGVGVDP